MTAPFGIYGDWSIEISFFIAFVIGIGFGFTVERAGFGNSRLLALQFYFKDLTVFKVMFTAIVTAMAGIIILSSIGFLDISNILIPRTYLWSGITGGLIMGVGFAIAGYCPGTSVSGLATLKVDAAYYLVGAAIGMFIFGEVEPLFKSFYGGELSGDMGVVTLYDYFNTTPGVIGGIILIIAVLGFIGAEVVEKKYGEKVGEM